MTLTVFRLYFTHTASNGAYNSTQVHINTNKIKRYLIIQSTVTYRLEWEADGTSNENMVG